MKICLETIPHEHQRYPTVGDWYYTDSGDWKIKVSCLVDWRYTFLVMFHEMIEMALCRFDGVPEEAVTEFDTNFEEHRINGDLMEPGDDPLAPYHWQHQMATMFEKVMARLLRVDWREYEEAINAL
jgi:hypothetical protein